MILRHNVKWEVSCDNCGCFLGTEADIDIHTQADYFCTDRCRDEFSASFVARFGDKVLEFMNLVVCDGRQRTPSAVPGSGREPDRPAPDVADGHDQEPSNQPLSGPE
jgi:hypothetical protein